MIKQRSKVIKLSLHLPQKKTFFVNFQLKSTKKPSKMRVFSININSIDYAWFS